MTTAAERLGEWCEAEANSYRTLSNAPKAVAASLREAMVVALEEVVRSQALAAKGHQHEDDSSPGCSCLKVATRNVRALISKLKEE